MKVVILAGGLGIRLSEETAVKPKPMVEIGGMPIISHIVKYYSHIGLNFQMTVTPTKIKNCYLIDNFSQTDQRGSFTKFYNDSEFDQLGIQFTPKVPRQSVDTHTIH